jgi:hypothetical protein
VLSFSHFYVYTIPPSLLIASVIWPVIWPEQSEIYQPNVHAIVQRCFCAGAIVTMKQIGKSLIVTIFNSSIHYITWAYIKQ